MISVPQAEQIIQSCKKNYGSSAVPLLASIGRVLAEDIIADRDLPPYHRVSMDGIAIRFVDYEKGNRVFKIAGVIGAGEASMVSLAENACFDIMTGAALPASVDTIIPYEHLEISDGLARITLDKVRQGQNIHVQGSDKKQGDLLMRSGRIVGAAEISVAASVGKAQLMVKKLPRVAIFSSGNELVDVTTTPLPYQIRRSNSYSIHATLQHYGINATMLHLPDQLDVIMQEIKQAIANFDVVLLSGGISMGKFDYIPKALEAVGVTQHFHKVKQRPGKPFWFGTFGEQGVVFALPGNPVSTYLCLLRYALPWLEASLGYPQRPPRYAVLDSDVYFEPALQYFLPVKLQQNAQAVLRAFPWKNNGSGDYASLLEADGFLELPADKSEFLAGEIFPVYRFS
jgi:molybdopterin molybdotransferase